MGRDGTSGVYVYGFESDVVVSAAGAGSVSGTVASCAEVPLVVPFSLPPGTSAPSTAGPFSAPLLSAFPPVFP